VKLRNSRGQFLKKGERGDDYRLFQAIAEMTVMNVQNMNGDSLRQMQWVLSRLDSTNCGYIMFHFRDFLLWAVEMEIEERERKFRIQMSEVHGK